MELMKRLCVVTAILSLAAGAGAQTFTVLKSFNPQINGTGQHPMGTLAQGPDGTLYGVTTDGGAGAAGVVFRVQTNGTAFTVIKSFSMVNANAAPGTNADGATPEAGLVLSGSTLYGTTSAGGSGGQRDGVQPGHQRRQLYGAQEFFGHEFRYQQRRRESGGGVDFVEWRFVRDDPERRGFGCWDRIPGKHRRDRFHQSLHFHRRQRRLDSGGPVVVVRKHALRDGRERRRRRGWHRFQSEHRWHRFCHAAQFFRQRHGWPMASGRIGVGWGINCSGRHRMATAGTGRMTGRCSGWTSTGTISPISTVLSKATDGIPMRNWCFRAARFMESPGMAGRPVWGRYSRSTRMATGSRRSLASTLPHGWGPNRRRGVVGRRALRGHGTWRSGQQRLGNGVVYSVHTDGSTPTALVLFAGFSGAADPRTGLALSGNMLFGTTEAGGTNGTGTLFEIGPTAAVMRR